MDYPKMLYRAGGVCECHGGKFDCIIVADKDEEKAAVKNDYFLTTTEAAKAVKPTVGKPEAGAWGGK